GLSNWTPTLTNFGSSLRNVGGGGGAADPPARPVARPATPPICPPVTPPGAPPAAPAKSGTGVESSPTATFFGMAVGAVILRTLYVSCAVCGRTTRGAFAAATGAGGGGGGGA